MTFRFQVKYGKFTGGDLRIFAFYLLKRITNFEMICKIFATKDNIL